MHGNEQGLASVGPLRPFPILRSALWASCDQSQGLLPIQTAKERQCAESLRPLLPSRFEVADAQPTDNERSEDVSHRLSAVGRI